MRALAKEYRRSCTVCANSRAAMACSGRIRCESLAGFLSISFPVHSRRRATTRIAPTLGRRQSRRRVHAGSGGNEDCLSCQDCPMGIESGNPSNNSPCLKLRRVGATLVVALALGRLIAQRRIREGNGGREDCRSNQDCRMSFESKNSSTDISSPRLCHRGQPQGSPLHRVGDKLGVESTREWRERTITLTKIVE